MRALYAGLAAVLVLAGCGSAPTGSAPPVPPPKYVAASCPAPGPAPAGATALGPMGGGGGRIPDGFQLAWVLSCPIEQRYRPGQGLWQVQVTERADLTPAQADALLAVLREPSDPSDPGQMCTAQLVLGPYFALVDRQGTAIVPALPTGSCGEIKPEATTALSHLPYREISTRPEAPVK